MLFGIPDPQRTSIVEVARAFQSRPGTTNTGARESCFAKQQRSKEYEGKNNIARRALPYPPALPRKFCAARGKANVKAFKRARQKARANSDIKARA